MTSHRITLLVGAMLFGIAGSAQAAGDITIVRDLASRVGPVIGSAQACRDIGRPRIQTIVDKFSQVIREASSNEAERSDLTQTFDRTVAEGRAAVTSGKMDCIRADRQLADLERSISGPSLSSVIGPSPAAAATAANAATAPTATVPTGPLPRGIGEKEIRFGIAAPFSGSARELGRQMKLGIETAFNRINDSGGVDGRMLKLFAADDGYEPSRTGEAMKQLYEKDQVFGIVGNVGTPTAAVAIPYALERRMLFFGAFTGSNILRNDPPDRYVFNYRASYAQETDAVVRYLVKIRRIPPRQIAVFAQQDSYGDAGFAGVAKAFRALGVNDGTILRLNYARNTVDVDDAVNQLKLQKPPIRAVVMVPTYRAAARFIEKTRDLFPGDDLLQRLVCRLYRACRRTEAAGTALHQRRDRDAGGAGGVGLFIRCARIQERARQIFPGRSGRLRFVRGLCRRQRPDRGHQAGRTAARYGEADRHAGDDAQSRPRSRDPAQLRPLRAPGLEQGVGHRAR